LRSRIDAYSFLYQNDMKAKHVFLHDLDAAVGFTGTLMTQEFEGSTTIVPQVSLVDYFWVSSSFFIAKIRVDWCTTTNIFASLCSFSPIRSWSIYSATFKLDPWLPMSMLP
jgi:hypothetical protein